MRTAPAILLLLAALAPAAAQTPAERASRGLDQEVARDRLFDAARDARGDLRPPQRGDQMFQPQRQTFEPDVGRPESGVSRLNGTQGLDRMGNNPQR